MKHRINIVHSQNFEALYINGELALQDRRIDPLQLMYYIKLIIPKSAKLNDLIPDEWWTDDEWGSTIQAFPKHFKDVKLRF